MTPPVKVAAVDLARPLPAISTARTGGGSYRAARVFVFRSGRPIGEVTIDLPDGGLSPAELGDRLAPLADRTPMARPLPSQPLSHPPLISVVVATNLARPAALTRCLASLAAQDFPRFEIIVVVNGRDPAGPPGPDYPQWSDGAVPALRVVTQERPGVSLARNRGAALAAGAVLAFTDDDAVADSGWLSSLAARFEVEPDADCVTGLVLPGELETGAQLWYEGSGSAFRQRYGRASFAGGPVMVSDRLAVDGGPQPIYAMGPYGTGCNLALRRDAFIELGGFDPALGPGTPARAGEDLLLILRLLAGGRRLAYEPDAVIWHWHRAEAAELRRQLTGFGRGFTAMLTAAVLGDRRHLPGLARMVWMSRRQRRAYPTGGGDSAVPAWAGRARRLGELVGPMAYLSGRLRLHRWQR